MEEARQTTVRRLLAATFFIGLALATGRHAFAVPDTYGLLFTAATLSLTVGMLMLGEQFALTLVACVSFALVAALLAAVAGIGWLMLVG